MDNKEHIDFEESLIRYLQGTADAQSLQQLLEVVRKSEDKKNELARLKAIYDSLSVQVDALEVSDRCQLGKDEAEDRFGNTCDKTESLTFRNIITLWSYAAVFYWLYYWQDNIFIIRIKVSGQNLRIATPGLWWKRQWEKVPCSCRTGQRCC